MKKFFLLSILFLSFLASCSDDIFEETEADIPCAVNENNMQFIIHAGGILWGRDILGNYTTFAGSNSLEGLEQCLDAGFNTVELDFCFTADGYLACIHNWSPDFVENVIPNEPMTAETFKNSRIYGNFTPMLLDDAADFLREHEEMTIVTDIKENFPEAVKIIAETDLADRFVVQIYHEDEYEIAREYGFEQIIYTLYNLDWDEKTDVGAISSFAETHPLTGIAFDKELCSTPNYVEQMKEIGVPLFVHTVNEDEEQFFEMGISGIYTDVLK